VKIVAGSELSLVSGNSMIPVVMEMASYGAKIRHVFADTFFAEHFLQ
jgi:hypothetical protein